MRKFHHWMIWLVFAGLILSACSGGAASPAPAGEPGMPEGTAPASLIPAGVEAARRELAQQAGLQPDEIEIQMYSPITWTNSCLNFEQRGQACAQVQTPGYNGMLIAGDALWEFRADESGRTVRLIPGAVLAARQVLGQQRGVPPESITLVSYEAVDWPTGCLGVELEGLECTQAVTPGYRVNLDVQGEEFEYHTDASGGTVLLAAAPEAQVEAVIEWQSPEGGVCETAQIGLEAVVFGTCEGAQQTGRLVSEERIEQLQAFVSDFASFEAGTPAGTVTFQGEGSQQPSPAEQRMIAEWAHLAFVEAAGGRSGASYGLAFSWHREGGIAGFCNDLTVYVTGEAYATSCEGGQPQDVGSRRLTAAELDQVYGWIDSLQGFEYEQTDPATADAMTIRMVFSGAGEQEATEAEQQEILDFAARLYTEIAQGPLSAAPDAGEGAAAAEQALQAYFQALQEKNYVQAAELFGGDTSVLAGYNPTLPVTDTVALLEAGCSFNGFQCGLAPQRISLAQPAQSGSYRFTVEFANPNGSRFEQGPCCGADPTETPPVSEFEFTVVERGNQFQVLELPVYVP